MGQGVHVSCGFGKCRMANRRGALTALLKILRRDDVVTAVEILMKVGGVVAPVERDDFTLFAEIRDASALRLDERRTLHSVKSALFPARDPFLHFDLDAGQWSEIPANPPRYLLGLHPCDTWGLEAFDRWMGDGTPDERYQSARANVTVIALECASPCGETCFCGAMGTWKPVSCDVVLTRDDDHYLVEALTKKGCDVITLWKDILKPAGDAEARKREEMRAQAAEIFRNAARDFDVKGLPAAMKASFKAAWWHDMAERCLDCGQCVAVCPTCTCFAMRDECTVTLKECTRHRDWDGCMFAPFAEVAGGHNFRRDRHARIRHRMNRKGRWLNERFGVPFCTGCGRCVTTCPVDISPFKVFRRALGEALDV